MGKQPGEKGGGVRRGKTAAGHFLALAAQPGHLDVLAARGKLHHLAPAEENGVRPFTAGEVDGDHRRKMPRPFAFGEVLVVASRHDVTAAEVGFVDPILVK